MIKGIKICGVSDLETLRFIVNHPYPPNYIGFITNYKKSKRFVDYEKLKELLKVKKRDISFVSVMVNPSDEFLKKIKNLNFDYYQLYDVSPERTKIIKEIHSFPAPQNRSNRKAYRTDRTENYEKFKAYPFRFFGIFSASKRRTELKL